MILVVFFTVENCILITLIRLKFFVLMLVSGALSVATEAPSVGLAFWTVSEIDSSMVWEEASFGLRGSFDAFWVSFSDSGSEVFFFIRCKKIK